MTAVMVETEPNKGDTDFFSSSVDTINSSSSEDAPLASDTDVSADNSVEGGEQPQQQQQQQKREPSTTTTQGVFGRLFGRRKKKEPTLQNGAADLLDDQRPAADEDDDAVTDQEEEESEEEGTADDEGEESDQEEEKGSDDEESDEEEDEDEDENPNNSQQDGFDAFGNFNQGASSQYREETDEEGDEMISLIGGPKPSAGQQRVNNTSNSRLGASLTKIFAFRPKPKGRAEGQKDKEKQSLLHSNNYETDEDEDEDDVEEFDEDTNLKKQKKDLVRSSGDQYHDDAEFEDDDLRSEPGEYRLESFYPSGGYRDQPSSSHQTNRRDLHGRIQGFGSDSALAYNHNAGGMDLSNNSSSRYFINAMSDQRMMSSMDISDERRGILNGVGKAVSQITQIVLQKRADFNASENQDRKRMLRYIEELEYKLATKERELQTWKERAEQLQKEVDYLNDEKEEEGETAEDDDEEEEEEESGSDAESEKYAEAGEGKQTALIVFEADTTNANEETGGQEEGTLIDITPTKQVFDPLEESKQQRTENRVDDDLADLAVALTASGEPGDMRKGEKQVRDETNAFLDQMELKTGIKEGQEQSEIGNLNAGADEEAIATD